MREEDCSSMGRQYWRIQGAFAKKDAGTGPGLMHSTQSFWVSFLSFHFCHRTEDRSCIQLCRVQLQKGFGPGACLLRPFLPLV